MIQEPTPVRVKLAGETFTGRLLCAPNAIGLVEVENARERRTVPARWCEPLTDAARKLLSSGDHFVGEPRDIAAIVSSNPNEVRHALAIQGWTLQEGVMLRDFLVTEAHRQTAMGRQAHGWVAAAKYAKAWVKEKRQRDKVTAAGFTEEQMRDPVFLLREGYHLIMRMGGELHRATGRDVFGDLLPESGRAIRDAMAHYVNFYKEIK